MTTYVFSVDFDPGAAVLEPLEQGLHQYSLAKLGADIIDNFHHVTITTLDEAGAVVGGIVAKTNWDWLSVKTPWIAEQQRGQRTENRLLARAEQMTGERGVGNSHLGTTEFQALEFYRKHGYKVFGAMEGKPAGSTWDWLKKRLRAEPSGPFKASHSDEELHESTDRV